MEKIFFILSVIVIACGACNNTSNGKYTIKGELVVPPKERVLLIRTFEGKTDTLGCCMLKDGKFEIVGNIESVKNASIIINEREIPILLEEGEFEVKINPFEISPSKIVFEKAGKEQRLLEKYWKLYNESQERGTLIVKDMNKALFQKDSILYEKFQNDYKQSTLELQKATDKLVQQHADSYLAAYLVYKGSTNSLPLSEDSYELLSDKAKQYDLAEIAKEKIDRRRKIQIGKIAPDFMLTTPDGQPFGLKDLKGKVKIIDFWASWCGPCRNENPNMVRLYQDFKNAGLEILSISLDENKKYWTEAIKVDNMSWKHASDLQGWHGDVVQKYAVTAVPRIIVLDADNRIVAIDIRGEELRTKVADMLK